MVYITVVSPASQYVKSRKCAAFHLFSIIVLRYHGLSRKTNEFGECQVALTQHTSGDRSQDNERSGKHTRQSGSSARATDKTNTTRRQTTHARTTRSGQERTSTSHARTSSSRSSRTQGERGSRGTGARGSASTSNHSTRDAHVTRSTSGQRRSTTSGRTSGPGHAQAGQYTVDQVRRNRIIFAAGVLIVIALVAIMAHSCMAGGSRDVSDAGSSNVQTVHTEATAANTGEQSSASAEAASAESASASSAAPESDSSLSGRDAELAVDPNRTDWNYETNGRKVVYLTIDDGPSDKTQQVLDILDKYNCKATFFVVGHSDDYFPMIKEAYDRGHTIGLHSYSHKYDQIYSSDEAFFEDLDHIAQIVKDQIGFVPAFIRFPGGSSNTVSSDSNPGIMSRLVDEVQARGFQYYDWNVSSGDGADHSTEEIVNFSTVEAPEYDNIMLLMHDSTTKQSSVDALPAIIEYWQAKGYTFEAIDRNSIVEHHGVNN